MNRSSAPPPSTGPTRADAATVSDTFAEIPGATAPDSLPVLTPRYVDLGVLGTGGMAIVHRVRDRLLDRRVAMKVLAARLAADPTMRARFLQEARLLAALRHPGIVPVHDLGELPDGRPYFTMDEVRGRSLGEVLAEGTVSLPFRIGVLTRVCACVAYAHTMGVLHRDLKPGNVMLGDEGEVRVVDWGIARTGGAEPAIGGERAWGFPPDAPQHTRVGAINGTPAYMAPEQAAGDTAAVGPHTDVYALGAVLYTLLAGRPPFRGGDSREVLEGSPPPVGDVAGAPLPIELVTLCEQAMARAPADRQTAAALGEALGAWLAGEQRVAHALAALEVAAAHVAEAEVARAEADQARLDWMARDAVLPLHADEVALAAHWQADNDAKVLDVRATLHEEEVMRALRGAPAEAPDLPDARERLADRLLATLRRAEDHHDADASRAIAEELREQVALLPPTWPARARIEAGLEGDGTITLATDPPGAEVRLARYEAQDRRMVEVPAGTLGVTPLREVPLGMGSCVLTVVAPGCAEVRLPVVVRRGERWARVAPGATDPRTLRLPRLGELGPDDCYVPAGWFVRRRPEGPAWPALRQWTESFVIRRFPVTHREYLVFLDDLWATGRRDEALEHAPGTPTGPSRGCVVEGGRFVLQPDEHGHCWEVDGAAFLLTPVQGVAYASWLAARTGTPWRLPTEAEWIHAARGADGRRYPMGDHLDPAWAHVKGTYAGAESLGRVGSFRSDASPYGVRDLAGGVLDFAVDPAGPTYTYRGGAYSLLPFAGRLDGPRREVPISRTRAWHSRNWHHGFRIARSAP